MEVPIPYERFLELYKGLLVPYERVLEAIFLSKLLKKQLDDLTLKQTLKRTLNPKTYPLSTEMCYGKLYRRTKD